MTQEDHRQTQEQAILSYLQQGHTVTPVDALELFGCFRLGARIFTLREKGYNIECERIQSQRNPHVHFGRYRLVNPTGQTSLF